MMSVFVVDFNNPDDIYVYTPKNTKIYSDLTTKAKQTTHLSVSSLLTKPGLTTSLLLGQKLSQ